MVIKPLGKTIKIIIVIFLIIIFCVGSIIYYKQSLRKRKRKQYFYMYYYNDLAKFMLDIKYFFVSKGDRKFPLNHDEFINIMIEQLKNDDTIKEDRVKKHFERYKYHSIELNHKLVYILEYDNIFDDIWKEEQHNLKIAWDNQFHIVPEECGDILRIKKGFWKDKYYKEPITADFLPNYLNDPIKNK